MRSSSRLVVMASALAVATWTFSVAAQDRAQASPSQAAETIARADAVKMKNPVKPAPASTAAGKTLYDAQCASCHGTTGKGDGKMAAMMNAPKPSDLTDATWKHGATDGEIYAPAPTAGAASGWAQPVAQASAAIAEIRPNFMSRTPGPVAGGHQ